MSELKSTRIKMVYNGEIYDDFGTVPCTQLYYRKSEVDKVIAELKSQKAQAEDDCAYCKTMAQKNAADNAGMAKQRAEALKRECHHKYKRCLAMAGWCKMSARENNTRMCLPDKQKFTKHEEYLYFIGYYHKWQKRWLKLAEKFKEAK